MRSLNGILGRPRAGPAMFAGLALCGLALGGLAGCSTRDDAAPAADGSGLEERPPVAVTVSPVALRPVQRRVSLVGTLHGFEAFRLQPKVEGRVLQLHVEVGDRVPPGTALLQIDPTDYELAVEEARRGLEQELAKLGLAEPPGSAFDIETLPAVVRARLTQENAQRQFARQQKLVASQAASRELYEQAETDVKLADASLQQARLDAETTLAAVRHRQAVLSVAEQRRQDTLVAAPDFQLGGNSGGPAWDYVVTQRSVSVGELVRAADLEPALELVIDSQLKLRVAAPERHAGGIRAGQKVEVRIEAYPGEVFAGEVARVNPAVDPRSRTFEVEVRVPNPDHRLKHGGFAKAEILTQVDTQAPTAPPEAIVRFAGVTKVFRIRDERAEEVPVELGSRGSDWVEVLGELQAGDLLVTSGQSQLANGIPVQIRRSRLATARRLR